MSNLDRVRWQCRRGLLELDLILDKFNREHLPSLNAAQLEEYQELLKLDDNDLLDVLMGRQPGPDSRYEPLLRILRA